MGWKKFKRAFRKYGGIAVGVLPQILSGASKKDVARSLQVYGMVASFAGSPIIGAALFVSSGLLQASAAKDAARRARAESDKPQPLVGNVSGGAEVHYLVFGQTRIGGLITQVKTIGNSNEQLEVLVAHSLCHAGGIEGPVALYIDETRLPATNSTVTENAGTATETKYQELTATTGDYNGIAIARTYFGLHTQSASADLVSAGVIASADHLRGIAYTRFALTRTLTDDARFQRAFPRGFPTVTEEIKGLKVYDPRLDSTRGGSGAQRADNPLTWTYSSTPALIAGTYLIMRTLDGGCGESLESVDWVSVAAAANICEQIIDGASSTRRYGCNIGLSTADSCDSNMDRIVGCMAGEWWHELGLWRLRAGAYEAPSLTITDDWLAGGVEVQNGAGLDSLHNATRVTWCNPNVGYALTEAYAFTNAGYEAEDGNRRLPLDVTLTGVTNDYQAQYLSQLVGRRSRLQRTVRLTLKAHGLALVMGQTVLLNFASLPEIGGAGNTYRVTARSFIESDGALLVGVTLVEERSDTYTVGTFSAPDTSAAANPQYEVPAAPTGLTATGVADGVSLAWSSPAPTAHVGIRIEVAAAALGPWTEVGQVKADTAFYSVTNGATVFFRIRAVNAQGQFSPYSGTVSAKAKSVSDGADVTGDNVLSLLANPNFEAGDKNWFKQAGWSIQNLPAKARRGNWVAVFTGSSATIVNTPYVAVAPGQTVLARARAMADAGTNGQFSVRAVFYDASGNVLVAPEAASRSNPSTSYVQSSLVAVVPSGAAYVALGISVYGRTTGTWYADDCSFATQAQDQRCSPALATGGLRSFWSGQSVSQSYDSASPATVTISVSAATLRIGDVDIGYNAMSAITPQARGTTMLYYLFTDDAEYTGGARGLTITNTFSDLFASPYRVYVGSVSVTVPAGASSGGGSGNTGGGACVAVEMLTPDGRRFGELALGDELSLASETDLAAASGLIVKIGETVERALRLVTANGAALVCSLSAPIAVEGCGCLPAVDLQLGDAVATLVDGVADWSPLIAIDGAGLRIVRPLNVGDRCFWAGENSRAAILHHNAKVIP